MLPCVTCLRLKQGVTFTSRMTKPENIIYLQVSVFSKSLARNWISVTSRAVANACKQVTWIRFSKMTFQQHKLIFK